jgi:hypothetical protein
MMNPCRHPSARRRISGWWLDWLVPSYQINQTRPTNEQANPEQSKHLETARVLVLGQWVDFTNLRTETYSGESRIPEVAFGTAKEVGFGGFVFFWGGRCNICKRGEV